MKIFNVVLSVVLVVGPFFSANAFATQKGAVAATEMDFELLTEEYMEHLVGGLTVGQVQIVSPANQRDVSNNGYVNYQINYSDVTDADFVLFTATSNGGSGVELDRRNNISGNGTLSGSFRSALIADGSSIIVGELVSSSADPYDACRDGTDTVYARGMRRITGNGR